MQLPKYVLAGVFLLPGLAITGNVFYLSDCYGTSCQPVIGNYTSKTKGTVLLRRSKFSNRSLDVTATIKVSTFERIMIRIYKIRLFGNQNSCLSTGEYVRFYYGRNASDIMTSPLCGSHTYFPDLYSKSNEITLHVNVPGLSPNWTHDEFRFYFESVAPDEVPTYLQTFCLNVSNLMTIDIHTDRADYVRNGRQIVSHEPLLGPRFADNLDCGILLRTVGGESSIQITVSWLYNLGGNCTSLDNSTNFLAFYEGANSTSPLVKAFCNTTRRSSFIITSQQAYIRFHTSTTSQENNTHWEFGGFVISYDIYDRPKNDMELRIIIGSIVAVSVFLILVAIVSVGICHCCPSVDCCRSR